MFIILAYDIRIERVGKVHKAVKKYLSPVQKSVFEGHLTQGQLNKLKNELEQIILPEEDSVLIYKISKCTACASIVSAATPKVKMSMFSIYLSFVIKNSTFTL